MSTTATRLITLILLLQSRPNQKAAELAQALGVSARTLHRYVGMLEEMGLPIYTERGPYGGFSLVRGYKMPPLIFSPEEAVAVTLGVGLVEAMWGRLYQEAARSVLAKLENLLPEAQRHEVSWAQRSLVVARLHRADIEPFAPALEKLRQAVRERRRVQMYYRSASHPEPQERQLDAYALAYRWGWWVVIGFCHLRQEVRLFRVDRIQELMLLSQNFQIPQDFNASEYLAAEFQLQPKVYLKMRFLPQAAHVALTQAATWETVEEQSDGSLVVGMSAPDLNWAASSVLAYGPLVEVLEPQELRLLVGEWAEAVSTLYNQK